jgi:hypothetical protein
VLTDLYQDIPTAIAAFFMPGDLKKIPGVSVMRFS